MSRFDSMISKGVNTYDADATDADILQGKTAYVAGEKVTGTLVPGGGGGGDWERIGEAIDIEAETTISKGNRIVCRANSSATAKTVSQTAHNIANVKSVSFDKSVIACSTSTVIAENTVITFYFKDETTGLYDQHYDLTITNFPSNVTNLPVYILISNDGKVGFTSWGSGNSSGVFSGCAILFDIDKENHTASYQYVSYSSNDHMPYNQQQYRKIVGFSTNSGQSLSSSSRGDCRSGIAKYDGDYYLLVKMATYRYNVSDDSFVSSNPEDCFTILKLANGSFTREYIDSMRAITYICCVSRVSGSNLFFTGYQSNGIKIMKYSFTSKSITYASTAFDVNIDVAIYGSGLYMASCIKVNNYVTIRRYQINTADLELVLVDETTFDYYSSNPGTCILSEDCSMAYIGSRREFVDFNTRSPINTPSSSGDRFYYCAFTADSLITFTYLWAVNPSTNAQYLASASSDDCTTADRIYGVASEDLAVGARGEARALFSTMT